MRQTVNDGVFSIWVDEQRSSFISIIKYDANNETLSLCFKDGTVHRYMAVPLATFLEFSLTRSFGSFYNSNIKNKFKTMANGEKKQPKRINVAKKERRYIDLDIDLKKINKDWLHVSEKTGAIYLKMVLFMLPDGEVDKYGRLGFIKQRVPEGIEERGEIIGNGEELEWSREEDVTVVASKIPQKDWADDLPF